MRNCSGEETVLREEKCSGNRAQFEGRECSGECSGV